MGMYKQVYYLGFKKSFQYRINFYLGLVSTIFPLAIQYFLWKGMYASSNHTNLFGYEFYQMLEYALFACLVSKLIQASFVYEISLDIKEGGIAKYLVKPISYFRYQFFCFAGEKQQLW